MNQIRKELQDKVNNESMTIDTLAKEIGVSYQSIRRILNGETKEIKKWSSNHQAILEYLES